MHNVNVTAVPICTFINVITSAVQPVMMMSTTAAVVVDTVVSSVLSRTSVYIEPYYHSIFPTTVRVRTNAYMYCPTGVYGGRW